MAKGSTNPDKQHQLTRSAIRLINAVKPWSREDSKELLIDGLIKRLVKYEDHDEIRGAINEACEPGRRVWDKVNLRKMIG